MAPLPLSEGCLLEDSNIGENLGHLGPSARLRRMEKRAFSECERKTPGLQEPYLIPTLLFTAEQTEFQGDDMKGQRSPGRKVTKAAPGGAGGSFELLQDSQYVVPQVRVLPDLVFGARFSSLPFLPFPHGEASRERLLDRGDHSRPANCNTCSVCLLLRF